MLGLFLPTLLLKANAFNKTYENCEDIPARDVALVFGCSPKVGSRDNLYFVHRMDKAAELWKSGKVKCILISGDNRSVYYNEPKEMKSALIERGVPKSQIASDYAGLRTLDSVVRAKKVFSVNDPILVTQQFQNERALFIAHHYGMNAVALNADDVPINRGVKVHIREFLARFKMLLDLYALDTKPRFLGEKVPLPL